MLLCETGSIWINIDDNECHYLKVLCDEIFGRKNFIAEVIWQKRTSRENRAAIGSAHDTILIYAKKEARLWKAHRNMLPPEESGYSNPDNDPKGDWASIPFTAQGYRPNQMYKIQTPTGIILDPPAGRCWGATEPAYKKLLSEGRIYFPRGGDGRPRVKQYTGEQKGLVPMSIWFAEDVGTTEESKKEILALFPTLEPFPTPKPERLIERILSIASNPGDIVLDSFLGSGTTSAVAHKMKRKWIGIEMGDHFHSHCLPRMRSVVSGEDTGGISASTKWTGGGGFEVFELAPSLLQKDSRGNWIISPNYDAHLLARAVCKHEGFKFWPDSKLYWKQGHSSEKDFIFITTEFLTAERLEKIASQLKPDESLLICAKAFKVGKTKHQNITIKKIPQMLLGRCEFGRDDYSLNVKEQYQRDLGLEEVEIQDE